MSAPPRPISARGTGSLFLLHHGMKSRDGQMSVRTYFQTPVRLFQSTDNDQYEKRESPKSCGMCVAVSLGSAVHSIALRSASLLGSGSLGRGTGRIVNSRVNKGQAIPFHVPGKSLPWKRRRPKPPQQVEREERGRGSGKGFGESEGRDLCQNLKGGQGHRGTCGDPGVVFLPQSARDSNLSKDTQGNSM